MPANLYGPGDNFDLTNSHVLPALIRKFHEAKMTGAEEIVMWGTRSPRVEFLHVDDLADAAVFLMNSYREPRKTIGTTCTCRRGGSPDGPIAPGQMMSCGIPGRGFRPSCNEWLGGGDFATRI